MVPPFSAVFRHEGPFTDLSVGGLGTLLDYLPTAAFQCDAQGLITRYNAAAVELWGRSPRLNDRRDRWCGAHKLYTAEGEPLAHSNCWMSRALRTGNAYNDCEIIIERPDGSRRIALAYANPIRDEQGMLVGAMKVLVDITDKRRAEQEARAQAAATERLEAEQQALREAIAGMEQVLGIVGHELRTPLASIRAISEFLVTDGASDTPEFERFLIDMSTEVDRMSDTVNNILEAARINSGRARWNWGRSPADTILADAAETIRPLIDASRVTLRVRDLALRNGPLMQGDKDGVRRLLVNLLSNACKHTKSGTIELSGRPRVDDAGHAWIEFTVRDTGTGIPPRVLERLGEAFALNSGVVGTNACTGTGLGLSICCGIAKAHGGTIHVAQTGPRGTTMVARLRADLDEAADGNTSYLEAVDDDDLLDAAVTATDALERLCA